MKNHILLFLLIIFSGIITAQQNFIEGQIADDQGNPIEFVNVLLFNAGDSSFVKGDYSEEGGFFQFSDLKQGKYFVSASMVGFNEVYSPIVSLAEKPVKSINLVLTEGLVMDEIMVVAKKPFIEMEAGKIVVNVENSAVNAGNSALEILAKSPGVSIDKDNNISLRGRQGVLVTINGKQQHLSGAEISQLLETLPAENINKIEIINNPSAKHDAEGNSGIINIQLRKNENLGTNGQYNAGIRQGQRLTYYTGINLNYRSDKLNIYGGGNYYNSERYQDLSLYRTIPFSSGTTIFDQNNIMETNSISGRYKLGADFYLSEKTTLGVLANYSPRDEGGELTNVSLISGDNAPDYSKLSTLTTIKDNQGQNSLNFNMVHRFNESGTKLSFDADYSTFNKDGKNVYLNEYKSAEGGDVQDPFLLKNNVATDINIFAGKLDFEHAFKNGLKLELGTKYSAVTSDNDTYFEAKVEDVWVNQESRTNHFVYDENVLAAYANAAKSFGKVQLQFGLRMEHTESQGNSITLEQVVLGNYTDLFPSLSLSHMIGEKHSLSYAYSRRLNRPNYQSLNPFIQYLDEYTFQKGNPFLGPQYSNAFSLNYSLGRSLFVSAEYSATIDNITEVIEQVSENNQTYQTYQNLENNESFSLSISAPKVWNNYWTSRINLVGFYNSFVSAIPSGILDNQSFGAQIYLSNNVTLAEGWSFELISNYQSGMTYGLFTIKPVYGFDFGINKSVLHDRGTVKFGVDDILKSRIHRVSVRQDDISLDVVNINDTRRVKLSFTYNFGNNKVKSARHRSTALEEESRRIQN
jgi:hypothetical protein